LYLFALLGLALTTIGSVRFVDMGLKAFVFTKADERQRITETMPSYAPIAIDRIEKSVEDSKDAVLTTEEIVLLKNWLRDYKQWQDQSAKIDPITAERHRNASMNLALILIGLPLWVFHWRIIRRETKNTTAS
jgi:hypothetical protein